MTFLRTSTSRLPPSSETVALLGRIGRAILIAVLCSQAVPLPGLAQQAVASSVLTIDKDRLFAESRFGQKMIADTDVEVKALQAENRRIEADLEAEEKVLTARRDTLSAEEFRGLATAFDAKVKDIRTARDAKARELALKRDGARQTFLKTAIPILAEIMSEKGASAIVDRSAIVVSFDRIDITDLAIARIDALLPPEAPAEATPGTGAEQPAGSPALGAELPLGVPQEAPGGAHAGGAGTDN